MNDTPAMIQGAVDGILRPGLDPATVNGLRLRKIMGRHAWRAPQRYGTDGWRMSRHDQTGTVIVSSFPWPGDPQPWTHASVAYNDHLPTHRDLVQLHHAVWGETGWSYQMFAPTNDHVNIHEHALHLWGRADGTPVLPNFGEFGSI